MKSHGFVLAFDAGYCRIATALVRALEHFHPGERVRVYTLDEDFAEIRRWAKARPWVEVIRYTRAPFDFGEWHPLVWAKLEAFASEEHDYEVVLDVDQILYRSLSESIAEAAASGKAIAASPDASDLCAHVLPSFASSAKLASLEGIACFNAGAMVVRPSREIYRDLIRLARSVHAHLRLPEQAVLNLWARENGGHHDLGDRFMLEPWSPKVLHDPLPTCLIHFWTPRPAFFGKSPLRSSEPSFDACLEDFEKRTGQPYPLARFERDFHLRLEGQLDCTDSRA